MTKHRVRINLPSHSAGELPNKDDKFVVWIDGMPINAVRSIAINCGVGNQTEVTLSFYAEVEGELLVDELRRPLVNESYPK